MKKIVLSILLIVTLFTPLSLSGQGGFALVVGAQVDTNSAQNGLTQTAGAAGLTSETTLIPLIGNIISLVLGFLGIIFIILLIYGGFLRMTARGEEKKIETSTGIITNAIIGVFIILASYIITSFVFDQIDNTVNNKTETPTTTTTLP